MTGASVSGVTIHEAMGALAAQRPVFHSEADFQFALATALQNALPNAAVRLEVPRRLDTGRTEYLDLQCTTADGVTTAIELKYFTRAWSGTVNQEEYQLRAHAARDLARLHYVHDVVRLERLADSTGARGIAVMLTNEPALWTPPTKPVTTRDAAFRLHDGVTLTGVLDWGPGFRPNRRELRGTYGVRWSDYSAIDDGPGGALRWTALEVTP